MTRKLLSVLILFISALFSNSFGRGMNAQPLEFEKISDNLYQTTGGSGANGGVYIGDNAVIVIDAKMNQESVDQVMSGIAELTDLPVIYLINTHSDGDHVSGNRYFPETVTIIAHENCRNEFLSAGRNGAPSEWNNPELAPFVPSITYKEKMNLYLGSKKVELWYFGVGHTTGDTVVYFPEEKTAFIGDQVFIGRAQLIHSYKGGNSLEHVKTLTKILEILDIEKICSGHSEIIDPQGIQEHIDRMKQMQDKVKSLMEQGRSLEEIQGDFEQNQSSLVQAIFNELGESNGS